MTGVQTCALPILTMFFTFWGLNVIRKERTDVVKKDTMSKMFGMMMPAGSRKLSLSKMNMMGMGTRMMRKVMRNKQIDSLESLIEQARNNGVEFIACQMSMDVMGITKEELIDGLSCKFSNIINCLLLSIVLKFRILSRCNICKYDNNY